MNRFDRALELCRTGVFFPIDDGYQVLSGDHLYHVTAGSCTCPGAVLRHAVCKHRLAVAVRERCLGKLMRTSQVKENQ